MVTLRRSCGKGFVRIQITDRSDGDCAPADGSAPPARTVLRQVHGDRVVEVLRPGEHGGTCADAAWTRVPGAELAVRTADCGPLALYGADAAGRGGVAAVHAGWRGLVDGVIPAALARLRDSGVRRPRAVVGPHICPLHYEFGPGLLETVSAALGPSVASVTAWGTPALDLGAAARLALHRNGAVIDSAVSRCTASDTRYFSHRARAQQGRNAMIVCLMTDAVA